MPKTSIGQSPMTIQSFKSFEGLVGTDVLPIVFSVRKILQETSVDSKLTTDPLKTEDLYIKKNFYGGRTMSKSFKGLL